MLLLTVLGNVALFRRAWIEIPLILPKIPAAARRSLQESVDWNLKMKKSGFKIVGRSLQESVDWNLATTRSIVADFGVALFRRAWIEINWIYSPFAEPRSLSSGERGLKLGLESIVQMPLHRRSLQESVDWNNKCRWFNCRNNRRSLQESVDWNLYCLAYWISLWTVALFRRAWIEIASIKVNALSSDVALFRRAWIEINDGWPQSRVCWRRSLQESVDWNQCNPVH